jgi:putative component of membrane protein insertase Oxa1/YidC/SpoIIIJ protein YidD
MLNVTRFIDNSYYGTKRQSKGILRFRSTKTGFHFLKKGWSFKLLSLLDNSLRSVVIAIIGGYQRHLSPRKGYSCTHRIVHGGDSCSQYVKKTLADKSLFETTLLARQRFRECNIAYVSSQNLVVESKGLVKVSVGPSGPEEWLIQLIIGIVAAIVALIFGRNNNCGCK